MEDFLATSKACLLAVASCNCCWKNEMLSLLRVCRLLSARLGWLELGYKKICAIDEVSFLLD